jgi:hypothetical protein
MVEFITGPLLDQNTDESGVVHTAMPDTDYTDDAAERPGYSLEHTPLTRGLVGWWPLSWGNARDLSGNDNHGTLNGGVTTGVAGRGGLEAMGFDGSDDNITHGEPLASGSTYTLAMWVRPSAVNDGTSGMAWRYENSISALLRNEGSGNFKMLHNDGNGFITVGSEPVSNDTWYHVAITWDGSTAIAYLDGNQVGSKSVSSVKQPAVQNAIGYQPVNSSEHYSGSIYDARVYSRALSSSEIQTLYEWGSLDLARPRTDGVAYYPLDGDANDVWGTNDGTNNGVTFVDDAIRGQAGEFEVGNSDYIELSDDSYTSITVSVWLKWDGDTSTGRYIASGGYDGTTYTEWEFWIDGSNLRWNTYDGSNAHGVTGPTVPDGNWVHAVGTYDESAGEYRLYINGELVGVSSDSFGPADADNSQPYTIGATMIDGSPSNHFDGLIDDVRIYDRALSPSEVFELYLWGTFGIDLNRLTVKA